LESFRRRVAPRPELDTELGFRLDAGGGDLLDQADEIICRERDEAGREFDDVEAQLGTLADVGLDRFTPAGQDVLDPSAGGDVDIVGMRQVDQRLDPPPRHQGERAAGELQTVHVPAHRFQDVGQIALAHHRVIGAADLGQSPPPWLRFARVQRNEGKRPFLGHAVISG
jgi:hypothetical protein